MKIGIYGKNLDEQGLVYVHQTIASILDNQLVEIFFHQSLLDCFKEKPSYYNKVKVFSKINKVTKFDLLISLGGDGTLLDAVTIVKDTGVPILGINTGRLGFLASISKENIKEAINEFFSKKYTIEKRSLLNVQSSEFKDQLNFALNEVTVIKKDTSSMITISVDINDTFLNSYWADGLIIATPTGSTGYSLSCGGPIISPDSKNFIITPIASHNLTVRPIVIPDDVKIKLSVQSRNDNYLLGLDSRTNSLKSGSSLTITKEKFEINLVKLNSTNFFSTIRNKLFWGIDKRN